MKNDFFLDFDQDGLSIAAAGEDFTTGGVFGAVLYGLLRGAYDAVVPVLPGLLRSARNDDGR